jgi:hypothetical protein
MGRPGRSVSVHETKSAACSFGSRCGSGYVKQYAKGSMPAANAAFTLRSNQGSRPPFPCCALRMTKR